MEKKLFFTYDNGDQPVTAKLDAVIEMLKVDAEELEKHPEDIEMFVFDITPIFMTQKEFEELPEAY